MYNPKIYIRDYGIPTRRMLAFAGFFALFGPAIKMLRDLFFRIEKSEGGDFFLLLSGDMQSGSDVLSLSGVGNNLLLLSAYDHFRLYAPDVQLIYSIVKPVTVGAFVLTGNAVIFRRALILTTETGDIALSGVDVDLRRDLRFPCNAAAFLLTGRAANIQLGIILNADAGAFALSGSPANLDRSYPLIANAATFTLSPIAAGMISAKIMAVNAATFTVSGNANDVYLVETMGLSGDMQSGSDSLLLSGDMQSGSDLLTISKEGL